MKNVLDQDLLNIVDPIPETIKNKNSLMELKEALSRVHFPASDDFVVDLENSQSVLESKPHFTVAFFELFMLQLGLALKRKTWILQDR